MNRRLFFKSVVNRPAQAVGSTQDDLHPLKPPPAPSSSVHAVSCAGSPRQYRPGDVVLVVEARAWLGCDEIGFYAIDASCPHLGCLVKHTGEEGFACDGHGSRFALDGSRQSGPAAADLRYLQVDLDEQGLLVIRRDQTAHPADRLVA